MGDSVACFVDFENLYHSAKHTLNQGFQWTLLVKAARQLGTLSVLRVYGNWAAYKEAQIHLLEAGFELIHTPDYRAAKGHDTRMIIDAVLLGGRPHIGTVVLGTGDSDFIDVVYHLRNRGKLVVVLAVQATTSPVLIQVASRFIAYESLLPRADQKTQLPKAPTPTMAKEREKEGEKEGEEKEFESLVKHYLKAMARKIRMTPHPQRPEALLVFYPFLKAYSGTRSFKEIVEEFQRSMREKGRFPEILLHSLPHQVFHAYALIFEEGKGNLWDRVVRLRSNLTSAKTFLDWCDMALTLWIAKGLGDINEIEPEPLAYILYADTRPVLVQRAQKVLEQARQFWHNWPPRDTT